MRRYVRKWFALLLASGVLLTFGIGHAASGAEVAEDFDNYFVSTFPTIYGEIINALPADEVANVTPVLRGLEFFGYLKSMGDVANAIDGGNNAEAAIETASTLAKAAISLASYQGIKTIAIGGSSVALLPLTALVTTIDITRSSFKAVAASQTALNLERLYYSVEHDSNIKVKGRSLGEGDPIRHDAEAVEHLWRKVIHDEEWGKIFKTYVTSELGQEWPEPSLWDRLTVPSDFLREDALIQEKNRLKAHIASLLLELNKVAQKREAQVLLAQKMRELSAFGLKVDSAEFAQALGAYNSAMKQLPTIQSYVAALPAAIADYRDKMEKGTPQQLVELRAIILPAEMATMIGHALVLRNIPPTDRRIGGERDKLLHSLKENYLSLIALRGETTTAEINSRLLAAAAKLDVAGSEFIFARHRCEKDFYDYAESFDAAVKNGAPQAASLVGEAKTSSTEAQAKVSEEYTKGLQKNTDLYRQTSEELKAQLKQLREQLAATSDSKQQEALRQAITRLENQIVQLNQRWKSYQELHRMNVDIDLGLCRETLVDIDAFVSANANKYRTVDDALTNYYQDARAKYNAFATDHSTSSNSTRALLGMSELEHLNQVMADNQGGYAGIDPEFLKRLMPETTDGARSTILNKSLTAMTAEILRQMGVVAKNRMEFYPGWRNTTLPSLRYMAGSEIGARLDTAEMAIDEALRFFAGTDPDDIQASARDAFKQKMEELKGLKAGVSDWRERVAKGAGMAGALDAYLTRAENNNETVRADGEFLSSLYMRFQRASSRLSMLLGMFTASKASSWRNDPTAKLPPLLTGDQIMTILDEALVLEYSRAAGLGLEKLVEGAFCEIPLRQGMATLTEVSFNDLTGRIAGLPNHDAQSYYAALGKVRDGGELDELLIRLCLQQNESDFLAAFAFDDKLARAAKKLADTLAEQRAIVDKNQSALDLEANKYAPILAKLDSALKMAREAAVAGDSSTVVGLEYFADETRREYAALGSTRQDVDDRFVELQTMIDSARQLTGGPNLVAVQQIQNFYQQFREAYEARDSSRLMGFMGDAWEAGDGTTLMDLEENLRRSFNTFDDIRFVIGSLTINPAGDGLFDVQYEVTISSRIFRRNIKHEEKSSVNEEVQVIDGRPRISRTLGGRFWYVE